MAKRFGRNRKRKILAERDSYKQAWERDGHLLRDASSRLEDLSRQVSRVFGMLGRYSAFAPLKTERRRLIEDHQRIVTAEPDFLRYGDPMPSLQTTVRMLSVMRSCIEEHHDHGNASIHLMTDDGSRWAYGFSGELFNHELPWAAREDICRLIAHDLMEYVSRKWPERKTQQQTSKPKGF